MLISMDRVTKRFLIVCCALFLAAAALAATETVSVIVRKTSIRRDRQFYAPTLAEAAFRDQLVVLARDKDWLRVRARGVEGWVHASAVAVKAVSVSAKEATGGVSEDDVALAGKGFNSAVESEYRKNKPQANFAAVDRMEQFTATEQSLADFRREGKLVAKGGAP